MKREKEREIQGWEWREWRERREIKIEISNEGKGPPTMGVEEREIYRWDLREINEIKNERKLSQKKGVEGK